MSGTLKLIKKKEKILKHDHFDLILANGFILRYNDPRRFGAILWSTSNPLTHKLLSNHAPEPLTAAFNYSWLKGKLVKSKTSIKKFIMNNSNVTGVGNIYANEVLFMASIHPQKISSKLNRNEIELIIKSVKIILKEAIKKGGSSIRDFRNAKGTKGYFQIEYKVYDREGQKCHICNSKINNIILGNRSSFFCPNCQSL